jgi:hypothetical protein
MRHSGQRSVARSARSQRITQPVRSPLAIVTPIPAIWAPVLESETLFVKLSQNAKGPAL